MTRAEARANLLRAWAAWDQSPPNPAKVNEMVDAQKTYAEHLGISFVHLNDVAMAWRRAGATRDQALDAVERGRLAVQ